MKDSSITQTIEKPEGSLESDLERHVEIVQRNAVETISDIVQISQRIASVIDNGQGHDEIVALLAEIGTRASDISVIAGRYRSVLDVAADNGLHIVGDMNLISPGLITSDQQDAGYNLTRVNNISPGDWLAFPAGAEMQVRKTRRLPNMFDIELTVGAQGEEQTATLTLCSRDMVPAQSPF